MHHSIKFVADNALPEGHDFVLIQTPTATVVVYRESAITPDLLEQSWAAYRALVEPLADEPRRLSLVGAC